MRLTRLSFEDWLEHAFGPAVRMHGNPWYFDEDAPFWDPSPEMAVDYLTRLLEEPLKHLEWYADSQIAQGLTYLFNTMASGDNRWLCSRDVAPPARRECVESIEILFRDIFNMRCSEALGHLSEGGTNALNGVCYMWWDVFPSIALPDDPDREMLCDTALIVMEKILRMPSLACQESALHGLGHWHSAAPGRVERIIDRYMARGGPGHVLIGYARSARCGCVL